MQSLIKTRFSGVALIAGMVAAAWSPSSFACSDTPVLASICIMATPATYGNFNRQYVVAAGQELQVSSNTALFSLLGFAYGGNNSSTFKLPDLRGKFLIGADSATNIAGATGGSNAVTLTLAQLPIHTHSLSTNLDLSKATVNTTLPTLTGTVNLAKTDVTGSVSGLKLKVVDASSNGSSPSGAFLGKPASSFGNLYSSATPTATLNDNAISGGTVSVTIPASSAPVSIPGMPLTTTLAGTVPVSGTTTAAGSGLPFDNRPAFIALTYYIAATNGLYPSRD